MTQAAQPTTAPAPTDRLVPELAAAMARLTQVLDRETELLERPNDPELARLQDEKDRLTHLYARAAGELRGRAGALEGIALPLRREMHEAAARLGAAVERNQRKLRAMTEAADRVVAAMVRAIKEQRGVVQNYAPARPASSSGVAAGVTLDQRL
jgi:hypothetical protein